MCVAVRIEIKTVKGRDYVQLIDDNGYLHHVGPANPKNLSACYYVLGSYESYKQSRQLRDYFLSKGHTEEEAKSLSNAISIQYLRGLDLYGPQDTKYARVREIEEFEEKITVQIALFKMLESFVKELMKDKGLKPTRAQLRKYTHTLYREASEEEKAELMKDERLRYEYILCNLT